MLPYSLDASAIGARQGQGGCSDSLPRELQRPRVGHPPSTAAWFGTARSGNQVSDEGLDRVESGLHCPRVPGGDSLSFSLASARGLRTIAPNRTRHSVVSVRGGPANFPHPQPRGTTPEHLNGVLGQCDNGCRRKTAAGTGAGARRWRGGRPERLMGTLAPLVINCIAFRVSGCD